MKLQCHRCGAWRPDYGIYQFRAGNGTRVLRLCEPCRDAYLEAEARKATARAAPVLRRVP